MPTLKYPTQAEFIALYKKFPGGTDAEFATFLETKGYGRIEDYIEDIHYMVRNTAVIPKEDYVKLKELYSKNKS